METTVTESISNVVQNLLGSIGVFNSGFAFLPTPIATLIASFISIAFIWVILKIVLAIIGALH